MTHFIHNRHSRRRAAWTLGWLGVCLPGCGGESTTTVVAPTVSHAANGHSAAHADPAGSAASGSGSSGSRSPTPKRAAPLRALPEGAARYSIVPSPPGPGGGPAARANFRATGAVRGPLDAVRVPVTGNAVGPDGRFAVASTPPPPGGAPDGAAPEGFEILSAGGVGPGGLPQRMRSKLDGMTVCLVPAGEVRLGPIDGGKERPRAFVSTFYMDEHEVTVGQFRSFLEQSGERTDSPTNMDAGDDLPAVGLPWRSAFLYARWAGRSLPTEAEWERAARGDDDFRYPWGYGQPVFGTPRQSGQIDPVKSFRADRSPFGVYDLAGNAGEWTLQTFVENLLRGERAGASGLYRNPDRGSGAGGAKTVRGLGEGWTPDRRVGRDGVSDTEPIGFRCVWRLTVDGTPGGDPLPAVAGTAGT